MATGKLICVKSRKYTEVELCFNEGMNIPFAKIKLYDKDLFVEASPVFDSASRLGKEIAKRWNEHEELKHTIRDMMSACGIPDPQQALRTVIRIGKEVLK